MGTNDCLSRCHIPPYLLVPFIRCAKRVGHNWTWYSFKYHSLHPLASHNGLCSPCFRDPARPHQYGHHSLVRLVGILCIRCSNDSNLMRRVLGLANPCNCLGQPRCDSVGCHDDNDASCRNDQHCLSWNTGSHLCSRWTLNWR